MFFKILILCTAKKIDFRKFSTIVTLDVQSYRDALCLALLADAYNPLRSASKSGNPIDIDLLKGFKEEFEILIDKMIGNLDIDTSLLPNVIKPK